LLIYATHASEEDARDVEGFEASWVAGREEYGNGKTIPKPAATRRIRKGKGSGKRPICKRKGRQVRREKERGNHNSQQGQTSGSKSMHPSAREVSHQQEYPPVSKECIH